jgi:hypothetical protein
MSDPKNEITRVNVWAEEMQDGSGEAWFYAAWAGDEHDGNGDVPRDVDDAVEWAQQQWPNAVVLEVEATA